MRKTVMAITAQRRAIWKDDDHGEPRRLNISPKVVRDRRLKRA